MSIMKVSGEKNVAVVNLHIPLQLISPGRAISDFFSFLWGVFSGWERSCGFKLC